MAETRSKLMATVEKKEENNGMLTLTVNKHQPFDGNLACYLGSTLEIRDLISTLFKSIFGDYAGCMVGWNNTTGRYTPLSLATTKYMRPGDMFVDLYFKHTPGRVDGVKAIITSDESDPTLPSSDKDKKKEEKKEEKKADANEKFDRINALSKFNQVMTTPKSFRITKGARDLLRKYTFEDPINWNEHVCDTSIQTNYNTATETYVVVSGLNFNKIIKEIFGDRDDDGIYQYRSEFVQEIRGNTFDFITNITRLDTTMVNKLAVAAGMMANSIVVDLR